VSSNNGGESNIGADIVNDHPGFEEDAERFLDARVVSTQEETTRRPAGVETQSLGDASLNYSFAPADAIWDPVSRPLDPRSPAA
jgi:hypothetical protein